MKVIYDETGTILYVSNDPREVSDVITDLTPEEVFDYKVVDKKLVYSPRVVEPANIEEAKLVAIKQLHDNYSEFYNSYTNSYSTLEVESFKDKADEAKAYMRDNTSPTPYVDAMVGGDPLARVEILNAIWTKVAYIASVEGQVVAKRDAIKATTTQEELDLIDITFGA